uniref:Uncharacterized protein n=1 Tax=Moniliophthora roreri TaxID=221103 RepID=A0A0W0FSL2_MONRR
MSKLSDANTELERSLRHQANEAIRVRTTQRSPPECIAISHLYKSKEAHDGCIITTNISQNGQASGYDMSIGETYNNVLVASDSISKPKPPISRLTRASSNQ